jgi:hypothetical protein
MHILAYLDPGSGSMIASAIAAGLAGILVVFKMGARRVAGLFMPSRRGTASSPVDEPS